MTGLIPNVAGAGGFEDTDEKNGECPKIKQELAQGKGAPERPRAGVALGLLARQVKSA